MSGALELLGVAGPLLVALAFPLALLWLVVADLRPGHDRPAPTRTAGVSALAQAVLGLTLGTFTTPWGTVPVLLWWLAAWLLCLGTVVLAARWRRLRPVARRPRLERAGAATWLVAAVAVLLLLA